MLQGVAAVEPPHPEERGERHLGGAGSGAGAAIAIGLVSFIALLVIR